MRVSREDWDGHCKIVFVNSQVQSACNLIFNVALSLIQKSCPDLNKVHLIYLALCVILDAWFKYVFLSSLA